jgi:hypothetical protein
MGLVGLVVKIANLNTIRKVINIAQVVVFVMEDQSLVVMEHLSLYVVEILLLALVLHVYIQPHLPILL